MTAVLPSDVSRTSNVSVSAYLRTAQSVKGQEDMGNDLLMARVDLTPVLDGHVSQAYLLRPSCSSMLTHPLRSPPFCSLLSPILATDRLASHSRLSNSMHQINGTTRPLVRARSI